MDIFPAHKSESVEINKKRKHAPLIHKSPFRLLNSSQNKRGSFQRIYLLSFIHSIPRSPESGRHILIESNPPQKGSAIKRGREIKKNRRLSLRGFVRKNAAVKPNKRNANVLSITPKLIKKTITSSKTRSL